MKDLIFYTNTKTNISTIYCYYVFSKYDILRFSTKIKVNINEIVFYPNSKTKIQDVNNILINDKLKAIKNLFHNLLNKNLSCNDIKTQIDDFINQNIETKNENDLLIKDKIEKFLISKSGFITQSSIRHYKKLLYKNPLANISMNKFSKYGFYDELLKYYKNERNASNNYINNLLQVYKNFGNYCVEHKYIDNIEWLNIKLLKKEKIVNAALTQSELNNLIKYVPITDSEYFTKYLFVIQCLTGLRWSDANKINVNTFNTKDNFIKFSTQKTKTEVIIPITKTLKDFINNNDYPIKKLKYGQYLITIREICKKAGIVDLVEYKKIVKGQAAYSKEPKYKLIGTHSARRTFVTLAANNNIPLNIIMKVTGHKNINTLQKYIKTDDETVYKEFQNKFI